MANNQTLLRDLKHNNNLILNPEIKTNKLTNRSLNSLQQLSNLVLKIIQELDRKHNFKMGLDHKLKVN